MDGAVAVYNIMLPLSTPQYKSSDVVQKHGGLVWEVCWIFWLKYFNIQLRNISVWKLSIRKKKLYWLYIGPLGARYRRRKPGVLQRQYRRQNKSLGVKPERSRSHYRYDVVPGPAAYTRTGRHDDYAQRWCQANNNERQACDLVKRDNYTAIEIQDAERALHFIPPIRMFSW